MNSEEIISYSEWVELFGVTYRPKSSLRWGGGVVRSQAIRARNARKAEAGNEPGYLSYLRDVLGRLPINAYTLESLAYMLPRDEAEKWLSVYGYTKDGGYWRRPSHDSFVLKPLVK